MKSSQNLLVMLLSFISLFTFYNLELAYSSFSTYESQIFDESSEAKVKKLQEVFKGLGLYEGEINGKFENIKPVLLDFQKRVGLISNENDYGAGYFGKKTGDALEKEFGQKYLDLREKYLKLEEIPVGETYFYVTAYYSPLPGQKKYQTGSYDGDIRLNGKGNHGASGKEIFAGMFAAPRNYPFGTKIYLDGIGIGEVGDRGGAIVNSGERGYDYDRIDVWVGYGDEGRERAIMWGKRKVAGQIVDSSYETNIEFDSSKVSKYSSLKLDAQNPDFDSVKELQTLFFELSMYDGEIDGNFEKIKPLLIDYQLKKGIISSKDSEEAGHFGYKTYTALRQDYGVGGGLFVEKYLKDSKNNSGTNSTFGISSSVVSELNLKKDKLNNFLNKKYKGDSKKIDLVKNQLKIQLESYIKKVKDENKKQELKYLLEII